MVDTLLVCYAIFSYSFKGPQLTSHYDQIDWTILSLSNINNRIGVDIFFHFGLLLWLHLCFFLALCFRQVSFVCNGVPCLSLVGWYYLN